MRNAGSAQAGSARMQILVVRANQKYCAHLQSLLAEPQVELGYPPSREEASSMTAKDFQGTIDLMISDVVMPHLGGAKLAAQLAASRPRDERLLCFWLCGEHGFGRHRAMDVTNSSLQKPFGLKPLPRKIRQILDVSSPGAVAASTG
jgi:response regulator RpfG family c-di-GMP phosphodiesterase